MQRGMTDMAGTTGSLTKLGQTSLKTMALKWGNVVALVAMVAVNAAANLIPLGGVTTGQVTVEYPTLFEPAAISFTIWGVIYALMAVYVVYQMGVGRAFFDGAVLRKDVGVWFMVSCLMNICWLLCWHYDLLELSLVFIVGLQMCLAMIALRTDYSQERQLAGKLSVAGMQLYLGWVIVATVANVGVVLVRLGMDGIGGSAEFWTCLMMVAATLLGITSTLCGEAPLTTLAIVWAFVGIVVRHVDPAGFDLQYPAIVVVAILGMVVMLMTVFLCVVGQKRRCRMNGWD